MQPKGAKQEEVPANVALYFQKKIPTIFKNKMTIGRLTSLNFTGQERVGNAPLRIR